MSFGAKKVDQGAQFVLGGLASMSAATCTHPIDLIKVRMQLQGIGDKAVKLPGPVKTAMNIVGSDGVSGLYKGLSASLLRQVTYSTTRFGAYTPIKDFVADDPKNPSMLSKMLAGILAGACGAIVGSPADLVLVRMQADGRLPPEQRYGYSNVVNGLSRIVSEEGPLSLWRGSSPTVVRAMLVTMAQISVYDILKQAIVKDHKLLEDGTIAHFTCAFFAGFTASVVTNPVDVVKSRIMGSSSETSKYTGVVDCFKQVAKSEGLAGLYKGFVPNFVRLGPQTILTLMFLEKFTSLYLYSTDK